MRAQARVYVCVRMCAAVPTAEHVCTVKVHTKVYICIRASTLAVVLAVDIFQGGNHVADVVDETVSEPKGDLRDFFRKIREMSLACGRDARFIASTAIFFLNRSAICN